MIKILLGFVITFMLFNAMIQAKTDIESNKTSAPHNTQEIAQNEQSTHNTSQITPPSAKKTHFLYRPIRVKKSSYGAFSIGYSYKHLHTQSVRLQGAESSTAQSGSQRAFEQSAQGVFFGLERGGHWHNAMLGGYINGVAAQDYSLTFGVRASYLIAHYIIPSVGIGYTIQHITFPNDSKQYNIQGASYNAGVFVNLARGFGVKLEANYLYPLGILRANDARAYENPTFSGYSISVSVCMYDFAI